MVVEEVTAMREQVYSHLVMATEMNQVSYHSVAVAVVAAAVELVVTMETCYLVAPYEEAQVVEAGEAGMNCSLREYHWIQNLQWYDHNQYSLSQMSFHHVEPSHDQLKKQNQKPQNTFLHQNQAETSVASVDQL